MRSSNARLSSAVGFVLASVLGAGCNHPARIEKDDSAKVSPLTQALAGDVAGARSDKGDTAAKPGKGDAAPPSDAMGTTDTPAAKDRIVFMDVEFSRDSPNLIRPCIKIARSIFDKVKDGGDFVVDFSLTYNSKGQSTTKRATVSVKDMKLDDARSTEKEKFIALMADVDVASAPPDATTTFSGTSSLLKRSLEGTSTLAPSK